MFKRLLFVLQGLTLLIPVIIFITYIVAAEGDQWTSEHYLMTGFSAIPFIFVLLIKYIVYGTKET